MSIAYVNGDWVPLEDAKVSVLDRGFIFGDGVYEVTAVIDGRLLDLPSHIARLGRSLREVRIEPSQSLEELAGLHEDIVRRNSLAEGLVYLEVTRGVADRDFPFPEGVEPTVVLFVQDRPVLDNPHLERGVKVVTTPDLRWVRRDIKSVSLLAQVLAKQVARDAEAYEAWMVQDGEVTEGASSTAFIVNEHGALVTRPADTSILPGTTRRAVLALAEEQGVTFEERAFTLDEAYRAREAFLTSATAFVLPVVDIDGHAIGSGAPGPLTRLLRERYIGFALGRR